MKSIGNTVQLKGLPATFTMRLMRVPVFTNKADYGVTNDLAQQCVYDTQWVYAIRWYVEKFHRDNRAYFIIWLKPLQSVSIVIFSLG